MINDYNARLEKLTALSSPFKAYLYDCDGTLADNMAAHKESYMRVAWDQGYEMDGAIVDELAGLPVLRVVEEINRRYGTGFDPAVFSEQKYRLFLDEYIDRTLPVPHVVDHLKEHAGRVKIGVVSGSSRAAVERTLQVLGLSSFIDVCVCAGETAFGKPHPHPFLTAAAYLGVKPSECLVFEDGEAGVEAAKAAGMSWVRIDQLDEPQLSNPAA
ncbi:haloacid dehalogenase superfamily, subfamily IA, variant 3 with third motif having DD or ED [Mucilaginibacter gossypiicola]|uniref:Haloacid dehalogenase superfamily, subfamily IA, variant 3 with third motif having DD or ED n=1 Tax=Mucilaginibacter gossypiicola TaxID=551995 RepID=A0A1H8LSK8_9SPHI|nr:HAD-IA family hydrolase [Mucilaginibacter gossypiicola]SEO08127.1 haloacid dehalogenase superfamily, subfamily IA, variant 3 with third motif having DD or ED [Mucilaginibacter gossypiicola]